MTWKGETSLGTAVRLEIFPHATRHEVIHLFPFSPPSRSSSFFVPPSLFVFRSLFLCLSLCLYLVALSLSLSLLPLSLSLLSLSLSHCLRMGTWCHLINEFRTLWRAIVRLCARPNNLSFIPSMATFAVKLPTHLQVGPRFFFGFGACKNQARRVRLPLDATCPGLANEPRN